MQTDEWRHTVIKYETSLSMSATASFPTNDKKKNVWISFLLRLAQYSQWFLNVGSLYKPISVKELVWGLFFFLTETERDPPPTMAAEGQINFFHDCTVSGGCCCWKWVKISDKWIYISFFKRFPASQDFNQCSQHQRCRRSFFFFFNFLIIFCIEIHAVKQTHSSPSSHASSLELAASTSHADSLLPEFLWLFCASRE